MSDQARPSLGEVAAADPGPPSAVWAAVDDLRLRAALEDAFTELALHPARAGAAGAGAAMTGAALATRLGYGAELLEAVPPPAVASFSGVGNPFAAGGLGREALPRGAAVLDIGCGSGTDLLIVAGRVGAPGRVTGVDMTPAMVERAQECVRAARRRNVSVEWGHAESLPLADGSVDLVTTNGTLTLSLDKRGVLRELRRVLRPGGRLLAVEVLVERARPRPVAEPAEPERFRAWIWGSAGGLVEHDLRADLERFAFRDVHVGARRPAAARGRAGIPPAEGEACVAEIRAVRR